MDAKLVLARQIAQKTTTPMRDDLGGTYRNPPPPLAASVFHRKMTGFEHIGYYSVARQSVKDASGDQNTCLLRQEA